MISPAIAANLSQPSPNSGGAVALSIILGVGISFFVLNKIRKKLRARLADRDGGKEEEAGNP